MKRLFLSFLLLTVTLTAQVTKVGGSGTSKVGGTGKTRVAAAIGTAFSQVQKKIYASTANSLTHNVIFDNPTVAGNLCLWCVTSDTTIPTPPSGLTLAQSSIGSTGTYIYYRVNLGGESQTTTFSITPTDCFACVAFEYSGMATVSPLDTAPAGTSYSGASGPVSASTGTLSQPDELIVAIFSTSVNTTATVTFGNSFVDQGGNATSGSTPNVKPFVATKKVASTATTNTSAAATANISGESLIVSFKITNP